MYTPSVLITHPSRPAAPVRSMGHAITAELFTCPKDSSQLPWAGTTVRMSIPGRNNSLWCCMPMPAARSLAEDDRRRQCVGHWLHKVLALYESHVAWDAQQSINTTKDQLDHLLTESFAV